MLGNRKLIVDAFCEVKDFVRPWQDQEFYNFAQHELVKSAIYVISRQQFAENIKQIKDLACSGTILPVLGNPVEGSETMFNQIQGLGIVELVQQNRILVITGGHLQPDVPHLYFENFLPKILDYTENIQAVEYYGTHWTSQRPYKFLCLNGRGRSHRQQLLTNLSDLLDQAIWTNLDSSAGPIKLLDEKYEFDFYQQNVNLDQTGYVKYALFNNDWGEIYLNPRAYLDTYFSLVTETVFDYPYTFRTEKIWKPVAIGHPFIVVSNVGYYRDLHDLGFRTFGHIINESFDKIENNQDRLSRIITVVKDLCCQDLSSFIVETQEVCKYNQQLLAELTPKVRKEFPDRFVQFVAQYQ